jgi:hypothetical protein
MKDCVRSDDNVKMMWGDGGMLWCRRSLEAERPSSPDKWQSVNDNPKELVMAALD